MAVFKALMLIAIIFSILDVALEQAVMDIIPNFSIMDLVLDIFFLIGMWIAGFGWFIRQIIYGHFDFILIDLMIATIFFILEDISFLIIGLIKAPFIIISNFAGDIPPMIIGTKELGFSFDWQTMSAQFQVGVWVDQGTFSVAKAGFTILGDEARKLQGFGGFISLELYVAGNLIASEPLQLSIEQAFVDLLDAFFSQFPRPEDYWNRILGYWGVDFG